MSLRSRSFGGFSRLRVSRSSIKSLKVRFRGGALTDTAEFARANGRGGDVSFVRGLSVILGVRDGGAEYDPPVGKPLAACNLDSMAGSRRFLLKMTGLTFSLSRIIMSSS